VLYPLYNDLVLVQNGASVTDKKLSTECGVTERVERVYGDQTLATSSRMVIGVLHEVRHSALVGTYHTADRPA
jgi:hypothetical protein